MSDGSTNENDWTYLRLVNDIRLRTRLHSCAHDLASLCRLLFFNFAECHQLRPLPDMRPFLVCLFRLEVLGSHIDDVGLSLSAFSTVLLVTLNNSRVVTYPDTVRYGVGVESERWKFQLFFPKPKHTVRQVTEGCVSVVFVGARAESRHSILYLWPVEPLGIGDSSDQRKEVVLGDATDGRDPAEGQNKSGVVAKVGFDEWVDIVVLM